MTTPPLPEPAQLTPPHGRNFVGFVYAYTAAQLQQYAAQCVAAAQAPVDMSPHQHAVDDWRLHGGPGDPRPVSQPVGEPVAFISRESLDNLVSATTDGAKHAAMCRSYRLTDDVPMYAAPPAQPAQVPLTDEQIEAMHRAAQDQGIRGFAPWLHLARAIERAHGIGEPT